jgi:excisionase family DNA binding protein
MTVTKKEFELGPALAAALLDVRAVAQMLNCSTVHVRRLADAGRMPRPLRVGTLLRWRKLDVETWISSGCPSCRNGGRATR